MPNKMLIDATHPEETRVVVLRGQRVEEFDFESASRRQLRGNIYLAKVTRVEPSLQAAFVDYGGNRHGFLAFSEIHPDYYQIPIADRQALIAEEERAQRAAEAEAERHATRRQRASAARRDEIKSEPSEAVADDVGEAEDETAAMAACSEQMAPEATSIHETAEPPRTANEESEHIPQAGAATEIPMELASLETMTSTEPIPSDGNERLNTATSEIPATAHAEADGESQAAPSPANVMEVNGPDGEEEPIESVGGADAMEEVPERMPRVRRQYKIQEVIKRRQIMLVQVVKEERGTKGAALTTYLSLAGRYSVLMPNTARGGGISRKITSAEDRRRLKEIAQELDVPEGMGVILRTAGASRTKTEVKRDFEYLLRVWETVRDLTLKSTAPKLVYEEGSLVKRSIRDLYNKEIEDITVAGEHAYDEAKQFMRMLMPSHVKNVRLYTESLPIFTRYGIESQLDAMFTPVMQLRSGGYIVINQAEALVAIDVNSGRATREHHIEDTALKTNLEAAEEIARQLRLRDLAGLIVIDFIDMDEKRNNRAVERRLKECLRHDRARIQVGHISHFGLLEMSRQRIRSSVLESSTEKCPHCGGTGHVRSVSSVALQLLRGLEELLLKGATHNLLVRTRSETALYLLNHKRAHLRALEERFRIFIVVTADSGIVGQVPFVIERGEQVHSPEQARALAAQAPAPSAPLKPGEEPEEDLQDQDAGTEVALAEAVDENVDAHAQSEGEDEAGAEDEEFTRAEMQEHGGPRGRRRRRRRGRRGEADKHHVSDDVQHAAVAADQPDAAEIVEGTPGAGNGLGEDGTEPIGERRRRRGRRGGRRNRREREHVGPSPDRGEIEPELASAVTDLDRPHADTEHPSVVDHEPQAEELAASEPHADDAQAGRSVSSEASTQSSQVLTTAPSDSARRRSTVREPAFGSLREDQIEAGAEGRAEGSPADAPASPSPGPVAPTPAEDKAEERPRRSGWWSKRVLGRH